MNDVRDVEVKRIRILKGYCRNPNKPCKECEYWNGNRCTAPITLSAIELETEDGRFLIISLKNLEWTTNLI